MDVLLIIGIILLVLWLAGFIVLPAIGWLINIVLVIALILLIIWLLRRVFKLF